MYKTHNTYYRISIKGLVFKRGKIMLCKEVTGVWELPGGGLDHGESIEACLKREVREEMGLRVTSMAKSPKWMWQASTGRTQRFIICYPMKVENLNFRKSDECVEIGFFSKQEIKKLNLIKNIQPLTKHFK